MQVLKLTKPVKIFDKETDEIELREPTGKDIEKLGYPFETGGRAYPLAGVVLAYVRRLGGNIPVTVTDKFTPADTMEAMGVVMSFFGDSESPQKSSET